MPARLQLALLCVVSSRVVLPTGQVSSWARDRDHVGSSQASEGPFSLLCRVSAATVCRTASGFRFWPLSGVCGDMCALISIHHRGCRAGAHILTLHHESRCLESMQAQLVAGQEDTSHSTTFGCVLFVVIMCGRR